MGLEETMKQRCYQHVSDKNQNICCTSGPRKHCLMLYCVSKSYTGQDGTFFMQWLTMNWRTDYKEEY